MTKSKDRKIINLHIRIKDLERLLRKVRKSERFWRKLHTEAINEGVDLSLALRFAAKSKLDYFRHMQKGQNGEWAIKDEKS